MNRPCTGPAVTCRLLAWPGRAHLRLFLNYALAITLLFTVVYVVADWWTVRRSMRLRVHLDAELDLPLLPWMVLFYVSLQLLFIAAPFILRTARELYALAVALAVVILLAGFGFVVIPAQLAYPAPENLGGWGPLFRLADTLNLDYNLVPSLHVAFTTLCVAAFTDHASRRARVGLWIWGCGIIVSTLLTHQHHALDVGSGLILGLSAKRFIYNRWLAQTNFAEPESKQEAGPIELCPAANGRTTGKRRA